ncbi:MAG: hypothetical protein NZ959_07280 [Armatimonadetes bacterium]|nr:hypothetical protein [Armatimonadota bacterium]MDW8122299.1 hypothetical protein [Armatimonadota bacterium]
MNDGDQRIVCSLCGFEFPMSQARATVCQTCPLHGQCRLLIKCPNCGYENVLVQAPGWLQSLLSKAGAWISARKSRKK